MDYKEKYLKYKKKYIDLKNIKGGNFIKFEADKNNYKIDNKKNNKKNGLFNGEIFIEGIGITKQIYNGEWKCSQQEYHYFGIFNYFITKKKSISYKIDCVGEFNKKGNNIIFSGIYSDKLINKDFSNYKNIPFNGYKPDNGNYRPIDELLEDEKYKENDHILEPYSKKTLFYQEGWYYLNYVEKEYINPTLNGYNACHNEKINNQKEGEYEEEIFLNILKLYSNYKTENERIKKAYQNVVDNDLDYIDIFYCLSHCLQINILTITVKEYNNENEKKFYYNHKIYSETNKYFNKKTIILYYKKDNFYTLYHNDDVIIYNLITDLEYKERIIKSESEIIYKNFGINNCGNSCYLNSCLQLLLHCPPLLKYLNEVKKTNEKNNFYNLNRKNDIVFNNGNITKEFYNNNYNIFIIINAVGLTIGKQEDSGDFFTSILNILIEQNILYENYKTNLGLLKIYKKNIDQKCYNIIFKNINNPINNIFRHYICSNIYCNDEFNSTQYDEQLILSLPLIKQNGKYDFNFNLELYFKKEELDEDNQQEDCKNKNEKSYKQIKLYYLSEIFLIQLKRFSIKKNHVAYDKNNYSGDRKNDAIYKKLPNGKYDRLKIDEEIDESNAWVWKIEKDKITEPLNNIPKNIDFENYIDKDYGYNNSTEYELIGYNVHQGGANSGHYVGYSNIKKENTWYCYDDHRNYKVNETLELKDAYFLMYQRIN